MRGWSFFGAIAMMAIASVSAEVRVTWERNDEGAATGVFRSKTVTRPQRGDAAKNGTFSILSGKVDSNSGGTPILNDGRVPQGEDLPSMNFFFATGTKGGRLLLDLGKVVAIAEVRSFSWHPADRGPQFYKLYALDRETADPKGGQSENPVLFG